MADGEIRMTRVPTLRDFPMKNVVPVNGAVRQYSVQEGMLLKITGATAPASGTQTIGEVVIDYCYEFQPDQASITICPVDVPLPGIQTNTTATNMYMKCPSLQKASRQSARRAADYLVSCAPGNYDEFMGCLKHIASVV